MDGLKLSLGGKNLILAPSGDVAVDPGAGAAPQITGKWNPHLPDNRIHFTLDNAAQPPLDAIYDFNANNQLVVKVKSGTVTSNAFTFAGRIELDGNNDIVYVGVDRVSGVIRDVGPRFLLDVGGQSGYEIEPKTNNLKITLTNGSQLKITGETPEQALEATANPDATVDADDMLMYQAVTRNVVGGAPLNQRSKLNFPGQWDINNGQVVFVTKVAQTGGKPDIAIGFAGRFKAVTAGFAYFADKTTKNVSLTIRGQHVFKSDDAQTNFDWETSIGFTGKTFRAKVDVDLKRTTAKGGLLDLKGSLALQHTVGQPLKLELSLQARYQFNEQNMLVFSAMISGGDRPAYDLLLGGSFVYSNLQLSFSIRYTSNAGAQELKAELGIQGDRNSMIKQISLVLDISEQQAKLKLNLSFSVRLRFANGIRLKDALEPIGASPQPSAIPAGTGD